MKKILAFVLALAMLLTLTSICSFAEETTAVFGEVTGESCEPIQYHNNGTVAARFKAEGKFHKVQFNSATWNNATGSFLAIDLYKFDTDYATSVAGAKVASAPATEMVDNANNGGDFGKDVDAGEYIAVLTFTGNACGLYTWTYEGSNQTVAFYRNGDIVPGRDMHGTIYYSDGTTTVGNITDSGEIPARTVKMYNPDDNGRTVGLWLNIADADLNCTGNVWTLFNAGAPFKGAQIDILYASNADQLASVNLETVDGVLELFAWKGTVEDTLASEPVASVEHKQVMDKENVAFSFGKTFPAGQYILRFSETSKQTPMPNEDGSDGVGVYYCIAGTKNGPAANVEVGIDGASATNDVTAPQFSIIFVGNADEYFKPVDKTAPAPETDAPDTTAPDTEAPQTGDMTVTVFAVIAVVALAAVVILKKRVNA